MVGKEDIVEPYIGITDFLNFGQVERMLEVFLRHRGQSNRKLHVGVMMSHKTLHGIPSKFDKAFPRKESIARIFSSDLTYNCLHYADYLKTTGVSRSLERAIGYGGRGIHAIQLDMTWPDPKHIARARMVSYQPIEVILQIGKFAFGEVHGQVSGVVERLRRYEGVIDRILLDKSMGKGIGMDATGLLPFVEAIKKTFPDLGIGVAGGLGPRSMNLVEPIIREFPDVSFDAQSKLRPSGDILDPIDWSMAEEYLIKAFSLWGRE